MAVGRMGRWLRRWRRPGAVLRVSAAGVEQPGWAWTLGWWVRTELEAWRLRGMSWPSLPALALGRGYWRALRWSCCNLGPKDPRTLAYWRVVARGLWAGFVALPPHGRWVLRRWLRAERPSVETLKFLGLERHRRDLDG